MLNIALIGAGRIGRIHAANIVAEPRLRLSHVVDPMPGAAAEAAAGTGAEVATLDAVLANPDIAGVVIASATDTHLDYSVRAITAGKAVFCEKPIDMDLARARSAEGVLGAPGTKMLLGFNRRFDPNFRALRDRLADGTMGAVETIHIISHDPAPPPIDYVRVSGGLFKDMAIHDFDMARWLLGEEPVEIYAAGTCLIDLAIGAAGDIDTAKCMLRTASGKLCLISNSRRSGYGYDQRIEAFCAHGLVRADNVHESTVETWGEAGSATAPLQNFFLDRYAQAYRAEMAHFADVIDGLAAPLAGYDDGVRALALAEAAAKSHEVAAIARL
ncbi:MAG TPA: inositol 2-dehydrogenase [Sphingomonas sp.]|nr:inositol 2-dehydrogenase [Sphingomonas sp.]